MKTKIGMNMMRTNPFSPSLPVAAITRFQKQPLLQTSHMELRLIIAITKNQLTIGEIRLLAC
jgi:hypothetical protein